MAAFSRLMVATLSDVEEYGRARLRQGLIKSNFLPGPFGGIASPSLLGTRVQTSQQLPRILTLPNEILKMILCYLEPIWLFQAEAAYLRIRALSTSLNAVWYDIIPPALFAEPEHFQNEDRVVARGSEQFSGSLKLQTSDARPSPLPNTRYYWDQTGFQTDLIVLPKVNNMSELSMHVEWSCNLNHPTDARYYPLIPTGNGSFRMRTLALGGSFQPEIDYRRELAGWLHYRRRCQICALPFHHSYRPHQIDFGVLLCHGCHDDYTLTNAQVQELPGLDKLIGKSKDPQWSHHRRSAGLGQWRPFVDDILRKKLGIDFEMALAKQKYLTHLGATLTASRRPTETNRTQLRNEIVVIAKRIWDFGTGNAHIDKAISFARSTFAPTEILQCFLFPPRSLDGSLLTIPFDDSERWLDDPTRLLNSRGIFNRTTHWRNHAAMEMVTKLCDWSSGSYYQAGYGGGVTAWITAADSYHMRRMEKTISADFAIQKLKDENVTSYSYPTTFTSHGQTYRKVIHFERLGVILAKLKIPPMSPVRKEVLKVINKDTVKVAEEVLNERELKMAKEVYFKKLLRVSCVGCPHTSLLAFSPGFAGVIKHFRDAHPRRYWTSDDWLIIG